MKVIGITGGVGAGKSEVLAHLEKTYNCRVIMADRLAHELEEPGGICYQPLIKLLGETVLREDGRIDRQKMAAAIFGQEALLQKVNAIVHPAVREAIMHEIEKERAAGKLDYLFIEAALLIEEGYTQILDELWYIHAEEEVRRKRLRENRGYSEEKIESILRSQLSEAEFRRHSDVVIENNGALSGVYEQIEKELGEDQ
ncbi:MAG: dephospho-CoA kinase [Bacteroidales bacterium]|nr:dephospho-CoA kinase [Bacteroidales bacterium]MCM1415236.1 dephospho-CoA kinase [bacterium]MCM1423770.1 dephospho-CoA kinase [bacterium]